MSWLPPTRLAWKNGPIYDLHNVVRLKNSVHDGNILSGDLVNCDVANFVPCIWRINEEKEVPAVKCGLHRATIWPEAEIRLAWGGSTIGGKR